MTFDTADCLSAIKTDAAKAGAKIVPGMFSLVYGKHVTAAAFRAALAQGVIAVAYKSAAGTNVYKAA